MSHLHRGLLAAAISQIEVVLVKTLESAVAAVAAPIAPLVDVVLEQAGSVALAEIEKAVVPVDGMTTTAHVDAAVASLSAAPVLPQSAPVVSLAALPQAGQAAAQDAVEALSRQLAVIATQVAAMQANLRVGK